MARRGGKRGDGEERRPPKLADVDPGAQDAEDQLFREAMENLERVPAKDHALDRAAAQPPRGARVPEQAIKIDLHRMTLGEAEAQVERVLSRLISGLAPGAQVKVQIITGKGRHSGGGAAVLPREIHRYVKKRFAAHLVTIEDSPADLVVGELPIRGHFHVTLGTKLR